MRSLEFGLQLIFSVFKNFSKTFPEYIRMKIEVVKSPEITQKLIWIVLKKFCEYIWMENPSYKNENIERKYLNNMLKNKF